MYDERYEDALVVSLDLLALTEDESLKNYHILALCAIAEVHKELMNIEEVVNYGKKVLDHYLLHDKKVQPEMQSNVFSLISDYYEYKEQLDSALFYSQKELEALHKLEQEELIFFVHIDLNELYNKLGDTVKADYHFSEASEIATTIEWEGRNIVSILNTLGEYCLGKSDYSSALNHLKKAFGIAHRLELTSNKYTLAHSICKSYIGLNQIDSIRKYFKIADQLRPSFFRLAQDTVILELQEKYETKEKEQEINYLNAQNEVVQQKNRLYITFVLLAIMVIALVIYLYTKQKKTATELKALQQTKDKLFSIIGHDLRTPFNVLLGFSKQLETDFKNKKLNQIESSLQSIHEASNSAYFLFEDLLGWTKAQTGKLLFEAETINLTQALHHNLELLKVMMQLKNIAVSSDITSNWVKADAYMLNTIFRNLLTNAIKVLDNNGQLKIVSKEQGAFVRIEIQDNGKGMDETTSKAILENNKEQKGLGMILCKDFVAKNGGTIGIKSSLGQGTTVWFTLPIATALKQDATDGNSIEFVQNNSLPVLSERTKKQLEPFLPQFEAVKVYYASDVYLLIRQIDINQNKELENWVTLMDKSVKAINEDLYLQLLENARLDTANL